jgi:signal transduction histidine kinase
LSPIDHWRTSTVRLLGVYGVFFLVWSVLLIGVIQWDTSRYLSHVVDQILEQRLHYLANLERDKLPEAMAASAALDLRDVMSFGLFDANGAYLSGNLERVPQGLSTDGSVRLLREGVPRRGRTQNSPARALALALPSGEVMVIARDTSVIDQVDVILQRSLVWGLSLLLIPGLIGGFLLSRGPLRRLRAIEAAVQPIMRGDLRQRLPLSSRRDELDLLAGIVNTMLAEIERLMTEVKGVCDSIAHDLRTPLTRLRAQLHRLNQEPSPSPLLEHCIADVEQLLVRFRALLRISEIEDLQRRAGFAAVDLAPTLRQVCEFYMPLAEEKNVDFRLDVPAVLPPLHADAHLIFEALSNLVDNAIKFTPAGGALCLRARVTDGVPCIEVLDSGPGIEHDERSAVLQRCHRGTTARNEPGQGLGLAIVAAVARLHGLAVDIGTSELGGARVSLLKADAGTTV